MSEAPMQETTLRLKTILENENALLLAGSVHDAAGLLDEKTQAMSAFQQLMDRDMSEPVPADMVREISSVLRLASENTAHLMAMKNGLQGVVRRMAGETGRSYVGSYGENGKPMAFPRAAGLYRADV